MRYRTFVTLSAGGMLLTGALAAVFYWWLDPAVDLTRTLLITALLTIFVLALDLLMWRLAPEALESAGFRLGVDAARQRRENPPAEEYVLGDGGASAGPRKVYKLEAGLRILGYGGAFLIAGMGLVIAALYLSGVDVDGRNTEVGPIISALVVIFFVGMGAALAHVMRSTRLELAADGVVYRTPGYSIVTSWENVRAIGPARYSRGTAESLLLHEPALNESGPFGALVRALSFAPDDAIPLQGFGSARYGSLSRDLWRYAPYLFGEDGRSVGSPDD